MRLRKLKPRRACALAALALALFGVGLGAYRIRYYPRAALLLLQLESNGDPGWLLRWGAQPVQTRDFSLATAAGPLRCRLYLPSSGAAAAPELALIHGVHWRGIDEPRLVGFARDFAAHGVAVLTPEIPSLKEYHIAPEAIAQIGDAAVAASRLRRRPVGVMGLSFAGSLALMAAADPRYASAINLVVAVGGYDDLPRVARFLISGRAELPDGSTASRHVEQYGALVLVYDYADDFFRPADVAPARLALGLWLAERYGNARRQESGLSAAGRARLEALFHYQLAALQPALQAAVVKHTPEMETVSPAGKLEHLHVPVFLLHGADDGVIPPSESAWLAHDIPAASLRRLLVTGAMGHVQPAPGAAWRGRWQLLRFIAAIFPRLQALPSQSPALEPAQRAHVQSKQ